MHCGPCTSTLCYCSKREKLKSALFRKFSLIRLGLKICKGCHSWGYSGFSTTLGPPIWFLRYMLKLRTRIFGDSLPVGNTRQNLHVRVFFFGSTLFGPMSRSGKHGHRPSVVSFCGWLHIISAGLQIVLLKEVCPILNAARSVIKLRKQLNTF